MSPVDVPAHPDHFGDAMRAVWRNLGWLLASRGLVAMLSLFYLGVIARSLGVSGFGRFALIAGAAQALATLVAFQTWQVIVQFGMGAEQRGDERALGRLLRGSLLLDIASAIVGSVLAALILYAWSDQLGISPTLRRAALIYAIVQVITSRSTPIGILRLRDHFKHAALADSVTPVVRFVGAWLVLLIHPTVQGFLVAWGIAEVLTAATFWYLAVRVGGWRLIRQGRGVSGLVGEHPGLLRFAFSTNASSTLSLSSKQLPLLFVGAIAGTAAAGAYRLAAQLAQSLAKLAQLLSRAAFPEAVRLVKDVAPRQLGRLLSRLFLASGVVAVVILLLVALLGKPVLNLIGGRDFRPAWPILLWLAAAGCLNLATVGVETVLTALQRAGSVFAIRAAGAAVVAGAAFALLPLYGAMGVAMAVAVGSAAIAAMMALMAIRISRSPP